MKDIKKTKKPLSLRIVEWCTKKKEQLNNSKLKSFEEWLKAKQQEQRKILSDIKNK